MSQTIPVDVIPSHVYLSQEDQATLFGMEKPMTIHSERSQAGQVVYQESVEVFRKVKRSLTLRVIGPFWQESHVELTPTEAAFLGLKVSEEVKSGDLANASACRLIGPNGDVELAHGAIIPKPP